MFTRCNVVATVLVVLILGVGCGKAEPTASTTPVPPTATPVPRTDTPVPPTSTPIPPTSTPIPPAPTATSVPPTATRTSTPMPTPTPEPTTAPYETIRDVPYVPDGDREHTLSLYLPETAGRQPLTLLVQGGAYMPDFVRHFAAQGYPVISFRVRGDSYGVEIRDTFCALAWARANASAYGLDPENIVPVGVSMYGGNVAMLGTVDDATPFLEGCPHPPLPETDRVRAVVALAGVLDYGEEADFFDGYFSNISDFMGGAPDEAPEIWAEASAITWVDGSEPPFLLAHGTADVSVDVHQSEKFAAALEGAGVDAELVLVPGVDHGGILRSREAFAAVEAFLAQLVAEEASVPLVIAFTSERDGNLDLYLMDVSGDGDDGVLSQRDASQSLSKERRLTHHPSDDYWAAWSPDGAHVAFASERDGDFEIYVMDVQLALQGAGDDGFLRQLTHNTSDDLEPCWSPDGAHIAFMSNQAGRSSAINVIDVDGNNEQQLTGQEGDDWLPAWSPDGTHIVFVSNRDGDDEIYVMNPDGSEQLPLTDNDVQDRYPAWSPDGAHITFSSEGGQDRGLYVMSADGSNVRPLTHGSASVWVSAWSPDGSKIAFTSDRDGNREIYMVNSDGSNLRRLTRNPGLDGIPAWRPSLRAASPLPLPSTRSSDGMVMLYVPGGAFDMGSTEAEIEAAFAQCEEAVVDRAHCERRTYNEAPVHTVTLDSFWIDRTEVTNAQYALCVKEGACKPSRLANNATYNGDDYPVAGIPWQDAADYCAWAGGRLPTEAEWEYAARGSDRRIYPWGDVFDCAGGNFNDDFTGCDDGCAHTAPVGSFPAGASWCGALDMAGNVWEWVADRYGDYASAPALNPTGPAAGDLYVLRGGSWGYDQDGVRAAYRYPVAPDADYLGVGLRCVVSAPTPPAAPQALQGPATEMDAYLSGLAQGDAFTGAVLVAQDGEVLLSKGYGLADRDEGVPNTSQTRFRIASITKQFTAMGVMILQAQGKLNVHDHVCDYVAECPRAWREITLHHLLVHTSGIPDFTGLPDYEATKHLPSSPLQMVARFKDLPLEFGPGEEWRYSNSGYILLGYVIEQASGQSYEAFLQENVFEPLQMRDSGYDHNLDSLAAGYTGRDDEWLQADFIDMSVPYAAGALYSTVEDMYRWDQALYTEQLIPQDLLNRMFTSFASSPLGDFGYGWIMSEKHGRQVVRHGGGGDGFTTLIERYPDDKVTFVLLSNRETTDIGSIASEIAQKLFGK